MVWQAKEERMVEHDELALEGRRLKGSLVAASQDIAGLENRKAQLRFSMEERKQEIQVSPVTITVPCCQHVMPTVPSLLATTCWQRLLSNIVLLSVSRSLSCWLEAHRVLFRELQHFFPPMSKP